MAKFALLVQGVDLLPGSIGDTVRLTQTADGANSILTWTYYVNQSASYNASWMGKASQAVEFKDLTNALTLFRGNLINIVRRQIGTRTRYFEMTAIGPNAWLDRLFIPSWKSKRPNGVAMTSDREMISSVIAALGNTPVGNAASINPATTYVSQTNVSMPLVTMNNGGTLGDMFQAIADAAATVADPTPRRFYIDENLFLHYVKGSESLTAPYVVGDANYATTVTGTSGIVSFWKFVESGGTSVADTQGYANATLNGSYTRGQAPITPNTNRDYAVLFNGSNAYATASGASLHPGDTFSVELTFQRSTLSTTQTMVSAGSGDYEIGFDSSNHIVVYKEGTGNNFVTDATYTDTSPHHLIVTRTPGTTKVYVDGSSKSGTATSRTFVAAAGAVNIGRRLSSTDRYFSGTLENVAVYSSNLSAATALAHYNAAWCIRPFAFEHETDLNGSGTAVYLKGTQNSGWVFQPGNSNYNQSFMLDTGQSLTAAKRDAIGTSFLKSQGNILYGGRFSVALFDGWKPNQTLTLNDSTLGLDGTDAVVPNTYQIRQIDTTFELGSGQRTYDIAYGTLPWSGTFAFARKRRRGSGASTGGTTGY